MSRATAYYAPLEEASFSYSEWKRMALADGEITPDETMALYPWIETHRPAMLRVLRTCRAASVLVNCELGIDSPTVDRVFRELRRG